MGMVMECRVTADALPGLEYTNKFGSVCGIAILMLHALWIKNAPEYAIFTRKNFLLEGRGHSPFPYPTPTHLL